MANVIFDFDGTLADTFPLIVDVSYQLSPGTKRLSTAEIDKLRRLPLLNSLLRLGIPWIRMPHLIRHTRKMLTESITKVPPYPGVPEMLKRLHKDGHKIFILSSNYPKNIQRFLRHHKLDAYVTDVQGVSWGNTLAKSFALRRLARMHSLELSSCYHVGNETLDMRAARWAGMRGIALVWSGFAARRLAKSRPFATVKNPIDLPKLLQ
jgi:phosphoglycolate phosphatase